MNDYLNEFKFLTGVNRPLLMEYEGTGVCIAMFVPRDIANQLALSEDGAEPVDDLHVTLCYLGKKEKLPAKTIPLCSKIVRELAAETPVLSGTIGGYGRFSASDSSDGKDVLYASVNVLGLSSLYEKLVKSLHEAGIEYNPKDSCYPHITLKYLDPTQKELPFIRLKPLAVTFKTLSLTVGSGNKNRQDYPLGGQ